MNGRNGKNVHLLTAKAPKYSTANSIPSQGNIKVLVHRNCLGVDMFLGQINLPHKDFDVWEKPKSRY